MSIMDPHPHPSLGRGNAAGSTIFEHEVTSKAAIANTSTPSTNIENAGQSPATSHSHHHHHHSTQPHHQFVDSSTVYHNPFRTLTPNSAEHSSKILDPQPQSKSSTPTNQPQTQSRPSSGSTSDWSVTGILPPPGPQPPPSRRPFSSSANLESSVPRESLPTSGGTGGVYGSPTTTTASRRSSSNPNPNPSPNPPELLPPTHTSTTAAAAAPSYYQQQHSGQDPTGLTMIATINCSGLDVRPVYGSEDSRQSTAQNTTQAHGDIPSPSHTRVPTSEEYRGNYYGTPTGSHYNSVGSGMLPSHYPHLSSPITPQSGPRRASSSITGGSAYSPYPSISVSVPVGSGSYGHHHTHHSDGPVVPNWSPPVDSVRDSVSPYSRPSRQPSGGHPAHHTSSAPFSHSLRNGQLLNSQHYPSNSNTAHPHHGTMQYNAQGRPLAYMCNTCFRAFDRPSALQIHERSHTGERPFPCPWNGCVKRFTTHGNMVKHSRVCPFREPED